MTAAPYSSLAVRLWSALGATVLCLVLGAVLLRAFGVGPSLFLFALAAIGMVDIVVSQRRRRGRRVSRVG